MNSLQNLRTNNARRGEPILGSTLGSRRSSKGLVGLLNSSATFPAEGQMKEGDGRRLEASNLVRN